MALTPEQKEYRTKHRKCKYCKLCDDSDCGGWVYGALFPHCEVTEKMVISGITAKRCKYYSLSSDE